MSHGLRFRLRLGFRHGFGLRYRHGFGFRFRHRLRLDFLSHRRGFCGNTHSGHRGHHGGGDNLCIGHSILLGLRLRDFGGSSIATHLQLEGNIVQAAQSLEQQVALNGLYPTLGVHHLVSDGTQTLHALGQFFHLFL